MKFNFKKISAVVTSVLMTGMTVGMAAAANYPAPFVENGVANAAIVYGTGAGVSSLDQVQAGNIQASLGSFVKGEATTTVDGGEAFKLYKDNDKLHFGDNLNTIMDSNLDDNDMTALADGEYDSGDIETDYEQTVAIGTTTLELIADSDLNNEEPTIGYALEDQTVLTYTLSFDDTVTASEMPETDFPLFGKSYYVLDAEGEKITLLNSAEKTVIAEGETVTIDGHTVSVEYITSSYVKFSVDGETTDKLTDGEYFELEDEYYIVLSENLYSDKDGTVSKAEFSLGSGKVVLENGEEVEVNEEYVDGFDVTVTNNGTTGYIDSVSLAWTIEDEAYLTKGDSIDMPVFSGEFGLVYNGLDFGASEKIALENGETLTLSMENYDVELVNNKTGTATLGGYEAPLVSLAFSGDTTFAISEDDRFLATLLDEDVEEVQTAYYEVASLSIGTSDYDLSLNDMIGADDIDFTDAADGDDEDVDDINVLVVTTFEEGDAVGIYNSTHAGVSAAHANSTTALKDFAVVTVSSDETLYWDIVVSDTGMLVEIPSTTTDTIDFYEANDENDVDTTMASTPIVLAMDYDEDEDLYAKVSSGVTMVDETADDKTVGYAAGVHATKVMQDSDARTLEMEYYADEVSADLQLIAGGEASTTTSALGDILVKDSEIDSVKSKNLVIVGGSCINSAAATVLGGAYCGEAFTEATGVGAGEFLIKGVQDAFSEGALALVVAGYEAADTANAATYLTKKDVDTMKSYKGTSATEATMLVE